MSDFHPSLRDRPADVEFAEAATRPLLVRVIGNFDVLDRGNRAVPGLSVQRLLALLALAGRPVSRGYAAARLWPGLPGPRGQANLRSAIWRLRGCWQDALIATAAELQLTRVVMTDISVVRSVIDALLDRTHPMPEADLMLANRLNLREDLLVAWQDEWVESERERHSQLRVHALEALSDRFLIAGHCGRAIDAALAAVRADPYREAAQAALVTAHLAEGDVREARRRVELYRALLLDELGVEPSREFRGLVDTCLRCCGRLPARRTSDDQATAYPHS